MIAPVLRSDAASVAPVCEALAAADIVAVDTEFHSEGRYHPAPMVVQLATPGAKPWLLDARAPEVLDAVGPALRAVPRWVVHAGGRDLPILARAIGGVGAVIDDTQVLAGLVEVAYPSSLASLLNRWSGVEVDKGCTLSDWAHRPLDDAQRAYAAEDVAHLLALHDHLARAVEDSGRSAIARDACDEAAADALRERPAPDAWRAVSTEARTDDEAARVQSLLVWRDAEARRLDKPPGYILSDALLRRLARTVPDDLDGLRADRRMRDGFVRRHGEAVLACLHAPSASHDPGVVPPHTPAARRVLALDALAAAAAVGGGFAPRLALPAARAHALASDDVPDPGRVRARLGPWRAALLGDAVYALLNGSLRMFISAGEVTSEADFGGLP